MKFSESVEQSARRSRLPIVLLGSMLACASSLPAFAADAARQAEQEAAKAEKAAARAEQDMRKADKDAAKSEKERRGQEQKLEAARKRLDEAAREVAELSVAISEDAMPRMARMVGRMSSRAILGVNIGNVEDDKRADGAEIVGVSPGGPAADAGLKAGDVITEIKGKALKREGDQSAAEQLVAAMRTVEPGEKVAIRYQRDGKTANATIVARATDRMMTFPFTAARVEGMPMFSFSRADGVFGSAEFVPMTPKLGAYFGTDKGLLVVRAPSDSHLQLEEGDVIVDIDGRVPTNPGHALRILGSYQPGEKLKLNVLRMKKRVTVDVTVPEHAFNRFERNQFFGPGSPPVPVAPPAPGISAPVMPMPPDDRI